MIIFKRILFLGVLTSVLVGCGNSGVVDLEEYVDRVKARPARAIEPLPEPKPYLPFSYTATFMRDPFQSQDAIIQPDPIREDLSKCLMPDLTRPKQYLEGFDIGSFIMVGTIENDKEHYALLRGAGGIHRIRVGDYIGVNHGQVVSINDFGLEVLEKISDGNEGCREKTYILELKN
ncbi:pilus assembly protein PilP [Entomomonas asaccharolytica]|uniref:pilus assembly protein PilP n=1 Tax=Entomomonas asaccharolytica TaxID=2785331 RepID=UPI001F1EB443|nr:pilus assembly protein PilP [Entomomonas asaccharolytica]